MFQLTVSAKTIFSQPADPRHVVKVDIQDSAGVTTKRVYVNEDSLEIFPGDIVRRSEFNWNDWIFDNLSGNVEKGAAIAALAVYLGEIK